MFLAIIKEQRKRIGLTQVDLAHRSNVSLPSIQNIEAGKANPSIDVLEKLAQALGLTISLQESKPNWALLSLCGCPILLKPEEKKSLEGFRPTLELLIENIPAALATIQKPEQSREKHALCALFLALQMHFPTTYKKILKLYPGIRSIMANNKISGEIIKLRRIAISTLATYL